MDEPGQPNTASIERLVEASKAGDKSAFDELVRLYQRRAMQLAIRILTGADEAADVVQDAFVKAFLGLDKIRDPRRFEQWLLKIVANLAVERLRKLKHSQKVFQDDYPENSQGATPSEIAVGEELNKALRNAMAKLPDKQAKAIALFGLQDMSQDEVAQIMNCSVESVRWHVFQARKNLKELLKDYL
ncbi:MAG: sigma-70 family RNA polymerase sigma factor [Sedimentisphaerales bacterium]